MKIPGYESQLNLQTGSDRGKISPEIAGLAGKNVQAAGRLVGQVGQMEEERQKLQSDAETKRAEVALMEKFNQIYLETQNDPDIWGASAKAEKRMREAIESTAKGVTFDQARNDFKMTAEMELQRKRFSLDNQLNAKQLQYGKDSTLLANDYIAQEYYTETDPRLKAALLAKAQGNMDKAVNNGWIPRPAAIKYQEAYRKQVAVGQVDHDLGVAFQGNNFEVDLGNMILELKKGEAGRYKNLTEAERGDKIEEAQRKLRVAKSNQENRFIEGQTTVFKDWSNMTPESLTQMWFNREISLEFYRKMLEAKADPQGIQKELEDKKDSTIVGHENALNMILNSGMPLDEVQSRIAEAYLKGDLKDKDVQEIGVLLELELQRQSPGSKNNNFINAMKAASSIFLSMVGRRFGAILMKEGMSELINKAPQLKNEQIPNEARKISERIQKENDPYANLPDGHILTNKAGRSGRLLTGADGKRKIEGID